MSEQQKQMTFQEWYNMRRANIILSYDQGKEVALKAFDELSNRYDGAVQQIESLKQALTKATEKQGTKPNPVIDTVESKKD